MSFVHYTSQLRDNPFSVIKNVFRYYLKPLLPTFIIKKMETANRERQLAGWINAGSPIPPPHAIKQIAIREYQQKFQVNVFIETGTFLGEMVEAQKMLFKKIISIELSKYLYEKARKRFTQDDNVVVVHGDSGRVLQQVLKEINEPVLFWLDGHYSMGVTARGKKDCPIFDEINAIFDAHKNMGHILLIDDARLFTGTGDYPTLDELTKFIHDRNRAYQMEVKDDIIRYWI
jgi:hypothetical protein